MINSKMLQEIEKSAQTFWNEEIKTSFFQEMAQGKEVGHHIADFIDAKTTGLLAFKYIATFQRNKQGNKVPRSMGDVWILCDKIFHPINVKTGVTGANGQPNMVSLKKLLAGLLNYQIDSYYLLIVKVAADNNNFGCRVHFVDMLDYLDYMTFDSGPGQIMLKAKNFFDARESGIIPAARSLSDKVSKLVLLLEDGERRLIINRKTGLKIIRKAVSLYNPVLHIVTPKTQALLHLL